MIYGIVKNNIVVNVVEAPSDTPFSVLFPDSEAVAATPNNGIPYLGYECVNGKFQPHKSWLFDDSLDEWEAPTPKPEDGEYFWHEPSQTWVSLEPEVTE